MPFDGKTMPTIAARMREAAGPNGENWCRLRLHQMTARGEQHCLLGLYEIAVGDCDAPWTHMSPRHPLARAVQGMWDEKAEEVRRGYRSARPEHMVALFNNSRDDFAPIAAVLDEMERIEI